MEPTDANQDLETIEDALENLQENYDNFEPTNANVVGQDEGSLNDQQNQSQPMAFPPQNWQPNAFQTAAPVQNYQMRSNPNNNNAPPQAFPPQSQTQPQSFPPPRSQTQPQAFPPSQNNHQQAFPHQGGQKSAAFQAQNVQQQTFPQFQNNQGFQHQAAAPNTQFQNNQGFQHQAAAPNSQFQNHQGFQHQAAAPNSQFQNHQGFQQQAAAFQQPNSQFQNNQGFQQQAAAFQQPNNAVQYSAAPNYNPQGNNSAATGFPLVNQNPSIQPPLQGWRTGLFECMNDPGNAIVTACVPCFTFGQIAEVVDSGQTSCTTSGLMYGVIACFIGLPCLISCTYRSKMRARFGLIETPAPDWLVHCLCEWCALCQEYRELQLRGLDPSIGWLGNVAKSQQVQMAPMTPPYIQTMRG